MKPDENLRWVQPSNGSPTPGKSGNEDTDHDQDCNGWGVGKLALVLHKLILEDNADNDLGNDHLHHSLDEQELAAKPVHHHNGDNCCTHVDCRTHNQG